MVVTLSPLGPEAVGDRQAEDEWPARLMAQHVDHRHPVRAALAERPVGPPDQSVNGIVLAGLGQRELEGRHLAKAVDATPQAVGPRDQRVAPCPGAPLVETVSVEEGQTRDGVGAERSAHLNDDCGLFTEAQLDLGTGGRERFRRRSRTSAVSSCHRPSRLASPRD